MKALRLGRFEVESPEWLAQRRAGIGGSDVAAILGLSPWTSAFSLWHTKTGGVSDEPAVSEQMAWGTRLEATILAHWRALHPEYGAANWQGSTWADKQTPWRQANPDFVATRGRTREVVEIKNAAYPDEWGPSGSTEVPVWYLTQLLWYCDVLGARYGWLVVLIGGREFREYRIDSRDHAADLALIREQTAVFWQSIVDGTPPTLDGSDATYQTVRALHPDIDDETVEIDPALALTVADTTRAKQAAELDHRESLAHLAEAMGTARKATSAGRPVATRQARGTGTPYIVLDRKLTTNITQLSQEEA